MPQLQYMGKVMSAQVSSPVELEQCDEETLAAILGTDAKVMRCCFVAMIIPACYALLSIA